MCGSVRCAARDAMQCAARGLVAFAWCRRRHAFDHGFFRWVGGWPEGWVGGRRDGWIGGFKEWVDGWVEREGKGGVRV
jgi:hypothetical protein